MKRTPPSAARRRAADAPGAATHAGLVLASHRRHYLVRLDDGRIWTCVLKGRSLTLACGDRVRASAAVGGGVVESVEPRRTLLYRSDAFKEKLIAANVTQIIGVVAPDLSIDEELLNRWMIAAEAEGTRFVLVANKADLPGSDALLARLAPYGALGYPVVPLSAKHDPTPLREYVSGEHTVFIGQSGMGKSTLLNALIPHAEAKTADVSRALATGRHTTTHATLYALGDDPAEGWIVDSPGIKAFGLAHVEPDRIAEAFVEFRPALGHCRFRDCRHDREPGCALQALVQEGKAAPHRLALLRQLVGESEAARVPYRAGHGAG